MSESEAQASERRRHASRCERRPEVLAEIRRDGPRHQRKRSPRYAPSRGARNVKRKGRDYGRRTAPSHDIRNLVTRAAQVVIKFHSTASQRATSDGERHLLSRRQTAFRASDATQMIARLMRYRPGGSRYAKGVRRVLTGPG